MFIKNGVFLLFRHELWIDKLLETVISVVLNGVPQFVKEATVTGEIVPKYKKFTQNQV